MARSAFSTVQQFVLATWIFYMGIFFLIDMIAAPVRRAFGDSGQEVAALLAGVLLLAPFILLWDWYVLDRYYPSKARIISKPGASESHLRSA